VRAIGQGLARGWGRDKGAAFDGARIQFFDGAIASAALCPLLLLHLGILGQVVEMKYSGAKTIQCFLRSPRSLAGMLGRRDPANRKIRTMPLAKASVPTANAGKYLQQLCKHWSHRLEVELSDRKGVVRFPSAVATLEAGEDALAVTIEAGGSEEVERLKGVVASHLDRFAFREAPLRFDWSGPEGR
jgi:uncharacterized protein